MKKDFLTLIHKDLTGDISPHEVDQLNEWLGLSEQNQSTYREVERTWDYAANYVPQVKVDAKAAFEKQMEMIKADSQTKVVKLDYKVPIPASNVSKTRLFTLRRISSIAAIFAVVLASIIVIRQSNITTFTAENEVLYVSLDDGSGVWIDKGSSLTLDNNFGLEHRNVTLTGKAHFDIERDESKPFNIVADDLNVSVLGTAFTIDARNDDATVAVSHGKVKVETTAQEEVILTMGMKATESSKGISTLEIDPNTIDRWTNENLAFDNAPLTKVFADLENFFDVTITYKGKSNLDKCPFTSKSLAKNSLDEILDILELTYNMRVKKKSKTEIELSRIRCRR